MKRLWLKDPLKKDNKDGQKRLNHKNMTTYPDIPFFLLWEKGLHMFGYARECQFYTVVPYIHIHTYICTLFILEFSIFELQTSKISNYGILNLKLLKRVKL